jgi:hypothetical protein
MNKQSNRGRGQRRNGRSTRRGTRRRRPRTHYPTPRYKRPRYTEQTLVERLSKETVVRILNIMKDPTRIASLRNLHGDDPSRVLKVLDNEDSFVFSHELWKLDLGDRLPDGDYVLDSRGALTLIGLAGLDTTGLVGTRALDRLKELVALVEAADASR